jgi:hypothetical protein
MNTFTEKNEDLPSPWNRLLISIDHISKSYIAGYDTM